MASNFIHLQDHLKDHDFQPPTTKPGLFTTPICDKRSYAEALRECFGGRVYSGSYFKFQSTLQDTVVEDIQKNNIFFSLFCVADKHFHFVLSSMCHVLLDLFRSP